jgi:hypothetical protein
MVLVPSSSKCAFQKSYFCLKMFLKNIQVYINIWYALAAKYIYMFNEQKKENLEQNKVNFGLFRVTIGEFSCSQKYNVFIWQNSSDMCVNQ